MSEEIGDQGLPLSSLPFPLAIPPVGVQKLDSRFLQSFYRMISIIASLASQHFDAGCKKYVE